MYRTEVLRFAHSYQGESLVNKSGNSKMVDYKLNFFWMIRDGITVTLAE